MRQSSLPNPPRPVDPRNVRRRRTRRIILIVSLSVGIPLLLIVSVLVLLAAALGAFHANVAEDAARPLGSELTTSGAQLICDNGDSGYGPDNLVPWYTAYY